MNSAVNASPDEPAFGILNEYDVVRFEQSRKTGSKSQRKRTRIPARSLDFVSPTTVHADPSRLPDCAEQKRQLITISTNKNGRFICTVTQIHREGAER